MRGHGWPLIAQGLARLMGAAWICFAGIGMVQAAGRAGAPLLEDAELADVTFVDPEFGWAVGDRGVIWHTIDGGTTWRRQTSGVECRLESVSFLDRMQGWAAGGATNPYTHTTSGVVLFTSDGGRRWSTRSARELPALKQVKFFNENDGVAVGEPSAVFPGGVFTSDNGGKSWKPIPGGRVSGWLAGDFRDPHTGAVAGRAGQLAVVRQRALEDSRTPPLGLRGAHRLKLTSEVDGWLVGDGALVLKTTDLGRSWQLPLSSLPDDAPDHFDFLALAIHGTHCWIAGTPGTRIVHSPDGGRSWNWYDTQQSLPILGLSFVDAEHGWAVGALGTILATADGGRTWTRQHSGGTRAAILALYAQGDEIPLELFARLSGNEGYLGVAHLVTRSDPSVAKPVDANQAERTHQALVAVGGCGVDASWRFPMPTAGIGWKVGQMVEVWNEANDGDALAALEAQLVRQIRTWRPEVVFTNAATPDATRPLTHLINQVVLSAVERAGDPTWYPEQANHAGLRTWKVRKVFGSLPGGTLGEVNLETAQLALRLGQTLADCATVPRGILAAEPTPPQNVWGFHLLKDRIPQEVGRRDFMSGILLHPGSEARRELIDASPESINLTRLRGQKRRNLDSILSRSEQTEQGTLKLLAQVSDLVRDLDDGMAGQILFGLAQQHYRQGHGDLAAETLELLVGKYPSHPLSGKAAVWLVQYWSSSETGWRMQRGQQISTNKGTYQIDTAVRPAGGTQEVDPTTLNLRGGTTLSLDDRAMIDRPAKADSVGKNLERTDLALFNEPRVRFPLASAHRRQGLPKQAERFYLNFRQVREHDAWWTCAEGERWLEKPIEQSPKAIWRCARAGAKPRLDGVLDDPFWENARAVVLKSPLDNDVDWPAVCKLAYDEEFLYLAVQCRRAPGIEYPEVTGPRPRDPDLSAQDRVELCLDLDRDWTTYYRLVVDHRGFVAEDCWGDSTWNPDWFVAAEGDAGSWTVEAAIPLSELLARFPAHDHVWAAGCCRIVPGVGFQSWTQPSSPQVQPEGFGYLIFE